MEHLFHLFKRGWFLALVGVLLLSLLIFFGGPFLAIADYQPLASLTQRAIGIVIVFVVWLLWLQIRFFLSWRKSQKLAQELAAQSEPAPTARAKAADRNTGELVDRFTAAVDYLNKNSRRGAGLYELPWFVIIGPPGSGKTTVLVNSGLNFPLEQKFGKDAVQGVGGTRNCDWWFTDQAVFLDTAGRFTTQDSDEAADHASWAEFLRLLKRHRPRRPVNGVMVALSLSDLMTQDTDAVDAAILAVRSRLSELSEQLSAAMPVYLVFTKADLIAGFSEFFDGLNLEGRSQVWGATFPIEATQDGSAAAMFRGEFDALLERLNQQIFARLNQESDPRRRATSFAFPSQLAALRTQLERFVTGIFASHRFDRQLLLRGVYLTSGTQQGTPVDRMLASLAQGFGLDPKLVAKPGGRGRAYFIQRLLNEVIFPESNLAGIDHRTVLRQNLLALAGYLGIVAVTVLAILALSVSYFANRSLLVSVAGRLAEYPAGRLDISGAGPAPALAAEMPRLNALWDTVQEAERYSGSRPWSMRLGLYQGVRVGNAARDAYVREMTGGLLVVFGEQLRRRLIEGGSQPERIYEYLKSYLMLGRPERLDRKQMDLVAKFEFERMFADTPQLAQMAQLHLHNLLADKARLRPLPLDDKLVERAREGLKAASLPLIAYRRIKLEHADDTEHQIKLDVATGLGSDRVLTRRSGKPLSEPVPAIYTRAVFKDVVGEGSIGLIRQFTGDAWVLSDAPLNIKGATELAHNTLLIYEQDYAAYWRSLLADITLVAPQTLAQLRDQLGLLSGPTSPLRTLFVVAAENTDLVGKEGAGKAAAGSVIEDQARDLQTSRLGRALMAGVDAAGEKLPEKPGSLVTAEFRPIHDLVEGPAGSTPFDRALGLIGQLNQRVQAMGAGVGQISALEALSQPGTGEVLKDLNSLAQSMPEPASGLLQMIGGHSQGVAAVTASSELGERVKGKIGHDCGTLPQNHYPFSAQSQADLPLADFGALFGYGGTFDKFFQDNLAALVDITGPDWKLKEGAEALNVSPGLLTQMKNAQAIREMFFAPGSQSPQARFTFSPQSLDPGAIAVTLEIDGKRFDYRHGPVTGWPVQWPGTGASSASISFQTVAGANPLRSFRGPWALFRLLDSATVKPEGDNFVASFELEGSNASFLIVPDSLRNPFKGMPLLRQFRCGN